MDKHRSTKSVKLSVGHHYPCCRGATIPKCGAKMPSADLVSLTSMACHASQV